MNRRSLRLILLLCDLIWIATALGIAILVRYWAGHLQEGELNNVPPVLVASLLAWPLLFAWLKLEGFRWGAGITAVFSPIVIADLVLIAVTSTTQVALRRPLPRTSVALFNLLVVVGLIMIRRTALAVIRQSKMRGIRRRVLIVGNGQLLREVQEQISRRPEFLYTVVGSLHSDVEDDYISTGNESEVVWFGGLKALLQKQEIDEVLVVERRLPHHEISRLFEVCNQLDIGLSFVPQTYEMYLFHPELLDLGGLPFIRLQPVALSFASDFGKRCIDLLLSCLVIPLLTPVLVTIAVYAYWCTGRCLKREARIGREAELFQMYSFNIDETSGNFGRLCLRLSLTELPQIINVVQGDMSWVGPRPEAPERARHYSEWQRTRLRVRPGITGLAQIHGLRTSDSSSLKTKFDLQYIQSWSPLLDLSVLMQTVSTVVARGSRFENLVKIPPISSSEARNVDRPYADAN
jgi:lipopolysaccharide/colanic/teichoic acid biosynthesis glycosyltransferase